MDMQHAIVDEEAVVFGEEDSLVGILTLREREEFRHAKTAVILLNAGIVHRVGAGRVYVKVARALASMGFLTLRFDFSGIGDSSVRHDDLQFEKAAVAEARDAMDFLAQRNGIEHFILLGGCSGAKIAFDTAHCDTRVIGTLLINFPLESADEVGIRETASRGTFAYYRKHALFDLRSWCRLLTGRAEYHRILNVLWNQMKRRVTVRENICLEAAHFRNHLQGLVHRNVQVTFVCSEGDHRLDDLKQAGGKVLKELSSAKKVRLDIIRRSDHTFSSLEDQKQLMTVLLRRADIMVSQNTTAVDNVVATPSTVLPQLQS